jgi:hypothetical protein
MIKGDNYGNCENQQQTAAQNTCKKSSGSTCACKDLPAKAVGKSTAKKVAAKSASKSCRGEVAAKSAGCNQSSRTKVVAKKR